MRLLAWLVVAATWGVATVGAARADARLPHVLSDGAVLQRDVPIRIWGWADPKEKVTVQLDKHTRTAVAAKDGRWEVSLPAMKAGGPHELVVKANNTLRVRDVLVGEVWFCSGQSNMALGVLKSLNPDDEIKAANYPRIRLWTTPTREADEPANDVKTDWKVCSPKTISYFSATAYYFGRELHKELDVPVGLIVSAVNGTRIEPWTPAVGVKSVKELSGKDEAKNGRLYNGMVHPFVPLALRGVLWYQGEGNVGDGRLYYHRMRALVTGWRAAWGLGDIPFYYVQMTPLNWGGKPKWQHAELWEAQAEAQSIPNTGMVVTNDVGNVGDAHPRNKQAVGRRLAVWALAKTYGKSGLTVSGPQFEKMAIAEGKVRLHFRHADGLRARDGKALTWFTIAGADKQFVAAQAKIDGKTVVVWSDEVAKPVAVRFAFHQIAEPNLVNRAGLPTSAFRTDRWANVTKE